MPSGNPFTDLIDTGASVQAGPVKASGSASLGLGGVADHHVSAGVLAAALLVLFLLWRNKFRFSTTVG